ncbi:PREDICTED: rootletin-like [Mandrillus leucophaeus]|uniref:rootletin-like n=1 Tax=Mandrillus leucophaeus TaxID=9568 RepID=UPI0005F49176|nr:PREDICTED: rootletin-like [Mandrillus leucophaeus]
MAARGVATKHWYKERRACLSGRAWACLMFEQGRLIGVSSPLNSSVGEAVETAPRQGAKGWSPIHLCCFPNSRVTELGLAVERLQKQNLEKDQVNKDLTEKLEALESLWLQEQAALETEDGEGLQQTLRDLAQAILCYVESGVQLSVSKCLRAESLRGGLSGQWTPSPPRRS